MFFQTAISNHWKNPQPYFPIIGKKLVRRADCRYQFAMNDSVPVPEVSVVMPCLNEAETLASCVRKAAQAFADHGIGGEIIVADNGSTDGSQ